MKKKVIGLALALLLSLVLCVPAMAASEYGVIYDETEDLGSQTLTLQGEQVLPLLSEELGLDLRVDVLTGTDYDSVLDTAMGIYSNYNYGFGEEKEGATLTILMESQGEDAYVMVEDGWCVYAVLSEERGGGQNLSDRIRDAVQPYMAERAWNGEDMTMSATALTQAVYAMADAVTDYFAAGGGNETDGEPAGTDTTEPSGSAMNYVYDISDLLTFSEWEELEQRAEEISRRHGCGVYAALVDDYMDYGSGGVYDVTRQLYHMEDSGFGLGDDRNGILLLLSMYDRDWAMYVYGDIAVYAFNEEAMERLEAVFLDDFGDDDWYGGLDDYLDACDEYLTRAEAGKPVRANPVPGILLAVGISCLIALVVCMIFKRKMKSVRQKAEANEYVAAGGLSLTDSYDHYTHTTETRRAIRKSSGSSRSERSGRSGKF